MREFLFFISIVSIIIFVLIVITRIILIIFYTRILKKYLNGIIKRVFKKESYPSTPKTDEELKRGKELEKAKALKYLLNLPGATALMNQTSLEVSKVNFLEADYKELEKDAFSKTQANSMDYDNQMENGEIIGIVKPIGKWTKKILGNRVTNLMDLTNTMKSNGNSMEHGSNYWLSRVQKQGMVKDSQRSQTMGRSRGRSDD